MRRLGLEGPDPAKALRHSYGARPTEDLVYDAWKTFQDQWLAHNPKASLPS
jgi:hypothetical protein